MLPKFLEMFCLKVNNRSVFTYLVWLFLPFVGSSATAQIIPDNTLPNNSVVTPNANNLSTSSGTTVQITGGTTVGNNLFHSFQEFSLPQSNVANFDNFVDIQNILTRVTGSNISNIDGLLSANGSANLFLINPNGIVLGENAALDIGGSFIGSTANSIVFQDSSEFSAVNPNTPPLLTINAPVGLNMGENSGEIIVKGTGNNIYYDWDNYIPATGDRPEGFAVNPQHTLSLVGNGISLEGGNITAEQGRIELGSVNQAEVVGINNNDTVWTLDYQNIDTFGDINLTQAASASASGNSGGVVRLTGKNISLTDGAVVLVETEGDGTGGLLEVRATDTVELIGDNPDTFFWTSFLADTVMDSTGTGGNITIDTSNLNLIDGGQITSVIYGEGDGGNIDIKGDNITITGFNEDELGFLGSSGIYTSAEWTSLATGGNISINAQNINLTDEAQIGALAWGEGDAGNIDIDAENISVTEFARILANAEIFSFGNAGNINIAVEDLYLANGGEIASTTFSEGNAGKIEINADTIELIGAIDPLENFTTGVFTVADLDSFGQAGDVTIAANKLSLSNGAQIQSTTFGEGNGGRVTIDVPDVDLSGFHAVAKSAILASAIQGKGDGGDITIQTDNLSIQDGATISVSNFSTRNPDLSPGEGMAGSIRINSQLIELDSSLMEETSSISASTFAAGGGSISLDSHAIAILNGSEITSETQGIGEGGNISIDASGGLLNLLDGGKISVNSTGTGDAGDIAIDTGVLNLDRGEVLATATKAGGGEISLDSDSLFLDNGSSISTSVLGSDGGGGNITIDNSNFIIGKNNSTIKADAVEGDGGNITIDTFGLFFDATSSITASSESGIDGIVEINDLESEKKLNNFVLANNVERSETVIAQKCPAPKKNTFAIMTKGGIPDNPGQYLRGQTIWQDIRLSSVKDSLEGANSSIPTEAKAWEVNSSGKVELVAQTSSEQLAEYQFFCSATGLSSKK